MLWKVSFGFIWDILNILKICKSWVWAQIRYVQHFYFGGGYVFKIRTIGIVFWMITKFLGRNKIFCVVLKETNDERITWIVLRNKNRSFFENVKRTNKTNILIVQTVWLNQRFYWTIVQWENEQNRLKMNEKTNETKFFWTIIRIRTKWIIHER